jgi:hypothetical protein
MIRQCSWTSWLLALIVSPLAAQTYIVPGSRAERLQALALVGTRSRLALEAMTGSSSIGVRSVFPNDGSAIDIFFDAVPEATTYTLRRATAADGPWTTLPPSQVRLSTNNYVVNPPCCEIMDVGHERESRLK